MKKIKKLLSVILAVITVMSMFTVCSFAENEQKTSLKAEFEEEVISRDTEFNIIISVENAQELHSVDCDIRYDSEHIAFVYIDKTPDYKGKYPNWNDWVPGHAQFECVFTDNAGNGFSGDSEMICVTFRALSDGESVINININSWNGLNQPENISCTVTVGDPNATDGLYKGLSYEITDDGVTITSCDEYAEGDIIIPDTVAGYPVTAIGRNAFNSRNSVQHVIIPDTVTKIDDYAFYSNKSIKEITIPENVSYIGAEVFAKCTALERITVAENNQYYSSDSRGALFNADKTCLIQYPVGNTAAEYNIPDGVITVGMSAFAHSSNLKSITIPDTVTTLEPMAFFAAWGLEKIIIPNSVTEIGGNVFSCSGIQSAVLSDNLTTIPGRAFDLCTSLKSIYIPVNVTTVEAFAFSGYENLEDIYYSGSESDWANMTISDESNANLLNATVHYNCDRDMFAYGMSIDSENMTVTVNEGLTAGDIADSYKAYDKDGNALADNALICTGCKFEKIDADGSYTVIVKSDVDGNGKISAYDARCALRASARLDTLEGVYYAAADYDGDTKLTASDARMILRKSAGLEK